LRRPCDGDPYRGDPGVEVLWSRPRFGDPHVQETHGGVVGIWGFWIETPLCLGSCGGSLGWDPHGEDPVVRILWRSPYGRDPMEETLCGGDPH
jgi:hypothetical protein